MVPALAADRLPVYPASWYLFCAARELRRGPISRDALGRRLVAYRTGSGRPVVLDARCSHLGADLAEGCVKGENIECPFHNWQYGPDGSCTLIPALARIPHVARQRWYPAVERHGYVYFFNGNEPLFPLPFFSDGCPDDFVAGKPLRFFGDCPWYMVNGNSFDAQHFRATHGRQLLDEPVVDCPHRFARRIRVKFGVAGDSVCDRLLRRFVGERVDVSITNWGGSVTLVTGDFRRTRSAMLTFSEPLGTQRCMHTVIVFTPKCRSRFVGAVCQPVSLWLRRMFTHKFMAEEFQTLTGIRYNPESLLDCDQPMVDFFRWVAELPRSLAEETTPGPCISNDGADPARGE